MRAVPVGEVANGLREGGTVGVDDSGRAELRGEIAAPVEGLGDEHRAADVPGHEQAAEADGARAEEGDLVLPEHLGAAHDLRADAEGFDSSPCLEAHIIGNRQELRGPADRVLRHRAGAVDAGDGDTGAAVVPPDAAGIALAAGEGGIGGNAGPDGRAAPVAADGGDLACELVPGQSRVVGQRVCALIALGI